MGRITEERESRVGERREQRAGSRVPPDTWNPVGSRGDHPPSLNTTQWPIVNKYCEGKVKRTPGGEWKRTWNPVFTSCGTSLHDEPRTFCRTVRRVADAGKVKHLRCGAEGKPSLKRAHIVSIRRPETGWSTHVQVEVAVKGNGGPNAHPLKRVAMRCG